MSKPVQIAAAGLSAVQAAEAKLLLQTYERNPVLFVRGEGVHLIDDQGNRYLDLLSGIGVNALGYAHPAIENAIAEQSRKLIHTSNLYYQTGQAELAARLTEITGLDRAFFSNSGSEAIEGALKLARAYAHARAASNTGQPKIRILALENSFHGRTMGAISITHTAKYREPFAPLIPGVEFVRFNDVEDLEAKFDGTVCAIVIEPIQGEGGVFLVSEEFWERARALATRHDAALIADEIQCGLGRTGRKFGYQKFPSLPDIVTVAKPLAGGLPLGAFVASEKFASTFIPGMHGSTFGGGPLVCAAALEFLTIVEDEDLLANVRARGAELRAGLEKLAQRFDFIDEIRGEGLIVGIDLAVEGGPFVQEALRQKLLINCTHEHILRLLPPFIVRQREVAEFLTKFATVLERGSKSAKKSLSRAPKAEVHTQPMALAATR